MATFTPVQGNPFEEKPTQRNGVTYTPVQGNPFAKTTQKAAAKSTPMNPMQQVTGFMSAVNRGLGIGDELAAAGDTAVNVLSGKTRWQPGVGNMLGAVGQQYRESLAKQRGIEDTYAAQHPSMAALGRGTGMAATMAVPAGGAAVAASRPVNMLKGAVTAATNAAGYSLADRGTLQERVQNANRAAFNPVTLGLGAGLGALAPATVRASKPVDENVAMLAREGVEMTPGQMRGGLAKHAEDAATSLPILGTAISEARQRGVESFNQALYRRALEPVGETLPSNIKTGSDAIKWVGDRLSKGYETTLPTGVVRADPGFAEDIQKVISDLPSLSETGQKRLAEIIKQRVTDHVPKNGVITGEVYKTLQSGLDRESAGFAVSSDPDHIAIKQAIDGIQAAIEGAAKRQDPKFAQAIDNIDRGWAELVRIERAGSGSGAEAGVFTPKQYSGAVRAAEESVRKRGVARGTALGSDIAQAGRAVLPSNIPDSGTAGRSMLGAVVAAPGAIIGGGMAGLPGAAAGYGGTLGGLALASRAYTPEAVQAANVALNARISNQARQQALRELQAMAASNPQVQALYQQVLRASGLAGASTTQNLLGGARQ